MKKKMVCVFLSVLLLFSAVNLSAVGHSPQIFFNQPNDIKVIDSVQNDLSEQLSIILSPNIEAHLFLLNNVNNIEIQTIDKSFVTDKPIQILKFSKIFEKEKLQVNVAIIYDIRKQGEYEIVSEWRWLKNYHPIGKDEIVILGDQFTWGNEINTYANVVLSDRQTRYFKDKDTIDNFVVMQSYTASHFGSGLHYNIDLPCEKIGVLSEEYFSNYKIQTFSTCRVQSYGDPSQLLILQLKYKYGIWNNKSVSFTVEWDYSVNYKNETREVK